MATASKTMNGGGGGQSTNGSRSSSFAQSCGDLSSNAIEIARSTEGWLELFLTPSEKLNFANWKERVSDKSIVHSYTAPVFQFVSARYLPVTLAPNVITLLGFLVLGHGWYLTNAYGSVHPVPCTWLTIVNIGLFYITTQLSIYHSNHIRQHTSLSDLFKYSCDMGSTVWLAILTTYCLGGTSVETQWYAVQSCQIALFLKHLSAYKREASLRYHLGAGPGEVLIVCMLLLAARAVIGLDGLISISNYICQMIMKQLGYDDGEETTNNKTAAAQAVNAAATAAVDTFCTLSGDDLVRFVYYGMFVSAIVQVLIMNGRKHGFTKFGLITSLVMRFMPALLLQTSSIQFPLTIMDVICDGLFLAVLTSDLTLAKMANRELHPWVVLMSMATVLSHSIILALVAVYYIAVFCDLCFYMNLPLLAISRNVYCDGVYDLCHIGHKRAFQNALALGNRLLVGVVGDKDASQYKRPPIMNHAERCAEVDACKAVTKVIPNAPCFGLTQSFLDEHQIHVVAFGEEYLSKYPNPDDDPYYGYVRKIGIAYPLPRTNTLSTTDLITRIKDATDIDKKSPT